MPEVVQISQNRPRLLLRELDLGSLSNEMEDAAESFVCKIYGLFDVMKTDSARVILFQKGVSAEALPPISNALHYHILTSHIPSEGGDKQML